MTDDELQGLWAWAKMLLAADAAVRREDDYVHGWLDGREDVLRRLLGRLARPTSGDDRMALQHLIVRG